MRRTPVSARETMSTTIANEEATFATDEAELAAAAFLARYSEWTLDAYPQ